MRVLVSLSLFVAFVYFVADWRISLVGGPVFGLAFAYLVARWNGYGHVAIRREGVVCFADSRRRLSVPWSCIRRMRIAESWLNGQCSLIIRTCWNPFYRGYPCGTDEDRANRLLEYCRLYWEAAREAPVSPGAVGF